jgi:hypothetical protein
LVSNFFLEELFTNCLDGFILFGNEMNVIRTMKLHDCGCGGIPQVSYSMKNNLEFAVVCEACGNQTSFCEDLTEAIAI